MRILGIDEAGRGPVIGSLFMAGVVINKEDEITLKEWGVKDSKLLSPKKREELYEQIIAKFPYKIIQVTPKEIDAVLSEDSASNLNWLEADHQAVIIDAMDCDQAIIDCPSPNTKGYGDVLKTKVTRKVDLIVENKADFNYLVVAAASIVAKVSRDRHIKALQQELGFDFGSGYLTDQKTQVFLHAHWKTHARVFRTLWAPYKALASGTKQQNLAEFSAKTI